MDLILLGLATLGAVVMFVTGYWARGLEHRHDEQRIAGLHDSIDTLAATNTQLRRELEYWKAATLRERTALDDTVPIRMPRPRHLTGSHIHPAHRRQGW